MCGTRSASRSLPALTPRESEIIALAAAGLTDKQIAVRLGISRATVRTHLQRVYRRNDWHGRVEAVAALVSAAAGRS